MARKAWSYTTGEKGRNRVRVFCKGCQRTCTRASQHTGGLYVEWYEGSRRLRELLREPDGVTPVRDTETAKTRADRLAAEFASISVKLAAERGAPLTLRRLLDTYNREVTPIKGTSKQHHDRRARLVWLAFLDAQPEPARHSSRSALTLDRTDWDRFIHWRRVGKVAGRQPVRCRQIEYDVKYMLAALNWAVGNRLITHNPWGAELRRSQSWPMPREPAPHRPAMTDALREGLIQHQPSWQMGLALLVGRHTRRRNSAVRQLLWSDLDFEAQTIRWRADTDKAGRANVTLMPDEVIEVLRTAPSRGIGEAPVFPSAADPSRPTSRDTFQIWLRRSKDRLLRSIEDATERERVRVELRGVGYHAEKRAGVRDPAFRAMPAKIQEEWAGTNFETLRSIYDDVTPDDMRSVARQVRARTDTRNRHQAESNR
jgi:integrase